MKYREEHPEIIPELNLSNGWWNQVDDGVPYGIWFYPAHNQFPIVDDDGTYLSSVQVISLGHNGSIQFDTFDYDSETWDYDQSVFCWMYYPPRRSINVIEHVKEREE